MILKRYIDCYFEDIIDVRVRDGYALVVVPKNKYHFGNAFELRSSTHYRLAASNHSPDGIFVLKLPGSDARTLELRNIDVAPTLLASIQLPISTHFDGSSLVGGKVSENYLFKWRLLRKISNISLKSHYST
jgi:hypothetical protein